MEAGNSVDGTVNSGPEALLGEPIMAGEVATPVVPVVDPIRKDPAVEVGKETDVTVEPVRKKCIALDPAPSTSVRVRRENVPLSLTFHNHLFWSNGADELVIAKLGLMLVISMARDPVASAVKMCVPVQVGVMA